MRICIQLDAPLGIPVVLDNLGCLYQDRGLLHKARTIHLKSLARKERNAFPFEIELTYLNLGDLYVKLEEYEEAEKYYLMSLSIARQVHNRQLEAQVLVKICELKPKAIGVDSNADSLLKRALNLSRRHRFYEVEARVHRLRGDWLLHLGNREAALEEYVRAIRYASKFNPYLLKEIVASILDEVRASFSEFQLGVLQDAISKYSPRM